MYKAPVAAGFAKFHASALTEWVWPHGTGWGDEAQVGAALKGRADAAKAGRRGGIKLSLF